jgi:hypothetical protein
VPLRQGFQAGPYRLAPHHCACAAAEATAYADGKISKDKITSSSYAEAESDKWGAADVSKAGAGNPAKWSADGSKAHRRCLPPDASRWPSPNRQLQLSASRHFPAALLRDLNAALTRVQASAESKVDVDAGYKKP